MAGIIWTSPAVDDLDAIADYISLDNSIAAKRLVRKVIKRVNLLENFPELGSTPVELRGTQYRHLVIRPLRVFYKISDDSIFIVYVMRSERLFLYNDLVLRDDDV